jgi:ATP-binding cassette subfamily F protein 3
MMSLFSLHNVTKFFGENEVLSSVSMQLEPGEKAGLVGANGTGKTTILKIIRGKEEYDGGKVFRSRGLSIGYLSQQPEYIFGATLQQYLELAVGDLADLKQKISFLEQEMASTEAKENPKTLGELMHRYGRLCSLFEQRGGYALEHRLRDVASGLGFREGDFSRRVEDFSGGEKTRVQLAALLLQEHDLLLLDEPTNSLDSDAIEWLEKYLTAWRGSLLVVSHDRFFLDRVVENIFLLDNKQVKKYKGNYSAFSRQRQLEQETELKEYYKQQRLISKEKSFIQNAKAETKRQAHSHEKSLEKLQRLSKPARQKSMNLGFGFAGRSGKIVVSLDNVGKSFGAKKIFRGVTAELRWGDRVAIVGPNGAGKSTLLRIITGNESCTEGSVRIGANVRIAYFDQEQKTLAPDSTPLEIIMGASGMNEKEARNYLGGYLFQGEEVFKKVQDLSGGEKRRLALAQTALKESNFLILDEPTNHLDIASMEKLEATLVNYPGTLLLVSHDRYFLSKTASSILELRGGRATLFRGNYLEYLERKALLQQEKENQPASPQELAKIRRQEEREKAKKERQRLLALEREKRLARKKVDEVELQVHEAENMVSQLEKRLADPAIYNEFEKAREIIEELNTARERVKTLLEAWEKAAKALEDLENSGDMEATGLTK